MGETFQEKHRKMYITFAFLSGYPPGLELLVSKFIQKCLYAYAILSFLVSGLLTNGLNYYFFTNKIPGPIFLLLLRKQIIHVHVFLKVGLTVFRSKQYQNLLETWNDDINKNSNEGARRKEEILMKKMKESYKYIGLNFLLVGVVPQIFNLRSLIDPYGPSTLLSFYPHSANDPYHFFFVFIHNLCYFLTAFGSCCYDAYRLHLLLMLSTQVQFLQESLMEIIDTQSNDKLKLEQGEVETKLKKWITEHQRTIRWAEKMKKTIAWDINNKYFLVGCYTCLVAFSIPRMLKTGYISDLLLVLFAAIGMLPIQFYLTRIIDDISEKSKKLCENAYGKNWYDHSKQIQRGFLTILTYCTSKPINFFAFGVFHDSSRFFLEVLQISYKVLSFLVQAPEQ